MKEGFNAFGIFHGLNLRRSVILSSDDIATAVRRNRDLIDLNIDGRYERRVKTLYAAIFDFTTCAGDKRLSLDVAEQAQAFREVARGLVQSVRSVKHLR